MSKEEERVHRYVFFIESHLLEKPVQIDFSQNYAEAEDLKVVFQKQLEVDNRFKFSVYRFTVHPSKIIDKQKKKPEYTIKLENSDGKKFEGKLLVTDLNKDTFVYDFKFEKASSWGKQIDPPKSYKFNHMEQFLIYTDYLNSENIKLQKLPERIGLSFSTQNLFIGKGKQFTFTLYMLVFLECFQTELVRRLLGAFKLDKIKDLGKIPKNKEAPSFNILKSFEKKPGKVLDNFKEQKDKDDYGMKLFSFILYYTIHFKRERMNELINNKNEIVKNYVCKALIANCHFFKALKLTKDDISIILNYITKFEELIKVLKYNNNLYDLLQIVLENENKIYEILEKENNNNNINVEEIVEIK